MAEIAGARWAPINNALGLRLRREPHRAVEFAAFYALTSGARRTPV